MGKPTPDEINEINIDYATASQYWTKYIAGLLGEINERGLMLTHAVVSFNEFINLPPGDPRGSSFWKLAWDFLKEAVPLLRLEKFITGLQGAAAVSVGLAKFADKSATKAKVVMQVTRALNVAGTKAKFVSDTIEAIDKTSEAGKNLAGKILSLIGSEKPTHEADNPVSKLDVTLPAILDLIDDSRKAIKAWSEAGDGLLLNYKNRIRGVKPVIAESLEVHIKRVLTPAPKLSHEELEEVRRAYLFAMVFAYCVTYVKVVDVTDTQYIDNGMTQTKGPSSNSRRIDGLNESQKKRIVDWFGPTAKRGKYFGNQFTIATDEYKFLELTSFRGVRVARTKEHKQRVVFRGSKL